MPFGVVGPPPEHMLANPPMRFAASGAGLPKKPSPTTSSRGATSPSAAGALARLLRLLQPPPVALLHSRIRSATASLPGLPLTSAMLVAMVDFAHDRLQQLHSHESDWPSLRPALLRSLRDGDYPSLGDYYNSQPPASMSVEWKPLHPGHHEISSEVVCQVLALPSKRQTPKFLSARPTPPHAAMSACLANLSEYGVVHGTSSSYSAMSLFLKPMDERSARIICDLRPLNALYTATPPAFRLPSTSTLAASTRWWSTCYYTKLDISAYFHSLSLTTQDRTRLLPAGFTGHPFVFAYGGLHWRWQRLPFGWSWAPVLAQKEMERIVNAALANYSDVLPLVYYDDLLLASPNPGVLRVATQGCVASIQQQGLRISIHKYVLEPTAAIDWSGSTSSTAWSPTRTIAAANSPGCSLRRPAVYARGR